jgi:hypothetical protein
MKNSQLACTLLLTAALAIPARLAAQLPAGTDINSAIPIYFGQVVSDIGDTNSVPNKVYSITLAKGQSITAVLSTPGKTANLGLYASTTTTIANTTMTGNCSACITFDTSESNSAAVKYTAAAAGTFYLRAYFNNPSVNFTLQVASVGTPVLNTLPTQAGCLTGQVDYLTYSLQLISAGLPDTASIGGTQMCATCTVKPPAYPEIVGKMETSIGLGATVSACYDSTGNIFQITLKHP